MPAAGVVMIVAVVLIVARDRRLSSSSTILALRQDHQGTRRGDRRGRRDHREERAGERSRRRRSTSNLDAGVDLLEGLLVKKAGLEDAVGLIDGLYPGAAQGRAAELPGQHETITAPRISEVYTKGTLTLARLGREAPIAAASPNGPALRNVECGSLAARLLYPEVPAVAPRADAALAGDRHRRAGAVRAERGARRPPADARRRRHQPRREQLMQTPAPCDYERATSVEGAIASLQRVGSGARIIAGGHSLIPMMKLRLATPEHLIDINDLDELAYIREQRRRDPDRRADAPRRPARVRAAGRALPGVPRRRGGDRRSGRAQPRHDRRLPVPGRCGRGPQRGLLGAQGKRRDPRRRRRAGRVDGRLPCRPVHDRGR